MRAGGTGTTLRLVEGGGGGCIALQKEVVWSEILLHGLLNVERLTRLGFFIV